LYTNAVSVSDPDCSVIFCLSTAGVAAGLADGSSIATVGAGCAVGVGADSGGRELELPHAARSSVAARKSAAERHGVISSIARMLDQRARLDE
jgi:hypothetical protein